ncbi:MULTISPECIES: helix-turn-helix transcriptional regulator [unclassified Clostridium]|uniref:helix-turn-helix domain-containing protein n=1 Tax=unclassified Clostridium TaxID=2614128 RepID=UPI00207A4A19|nr:MULTISPECIES: helix-turn-helix transcriptional regulator [unclassified Clostridium]
MLKLRIREFRIKKHMSQEQVALKANKCQTYISLLEKGCLRVKSPTLKTIEAVAKALGCCIYDLIVCDCEKCQQKRKEHSKE